MNAPSDHCLELVRKGDKDRFLSSLFAPDDKRPHLLALYAFNLEITRIRDLVSDPRERALVECLQRKMEFDGMIAGSEVFRNQHPDFAKRGIPGAGVAAGISATATVFFAGWSGPTDTTAARCWSLPEFAMGVWPVKR